MLPARLRCIAQRVLYACSFGKNKSSCLQFALNYIKVSAKLMAPSEKRLQEVPANCSRVSLGSRPATGDTGRSQPRGGDTLSAFSPCWCLPQTFIITETLVPLPSAPKCPSCSNTPSVPVRLHVPARTQGRLLQAATAPGPPLLPILPLRPAAQRPAAATMAPRPCHPTPSPSPVTPRSNQGGPSPGAQRGGPRSSAPISSTQHLAHATVLPRRADAAQGRAMLQSCVRVRYCWGLLRFACNGILPSSGCRQELSRVQGTLWSRSPRLWERLEMLRAVPSAVEPFSSSGANVNRAASLRSSPPDTDLA